MKKLSFIFALLCASVMGSFSWAYTVDVNTTIPGGSSSEVYQWQLIDGVSGPKDVVNIQQPGWACATEKGIYVTLEDAGFNKMTINGVETTYCNTNGADVLLLLSLFDEEYTDVKILNGTTEKWGLRIHNLNANSGSGSGGGEEPTVDWGEISYLSGSTQYKAVVTPEIPGSFGIQNVQDNAVYVTFPDAVFDFTWLNEHNIVYRQLGSGMFFDLANFAAVENLSFTINNHGTNYTITVHNDSPLTAPAAKAAAPTKPAQQARAIYSQYALNTGMVRLGWSGGSRSDVLIDGRITPTFTLGNQLGLGFGYTNISSMDKLHMDIWTEDSYSINVCLISSGAGEHNYSQALTGGEWNSVDIAISEFQANNTAVEAIKLSGSTAEGKIIFLDNIYFYAENALPDPDPSQVQDVNFAVRTNGAIAYPSSVRGENFAARAIDGDNGTMWESVWDQDPQSLTIDLGQRRIFNTVQMRLYERYASNFYLEVSNNGVDWTEAKAITGYSNESADNYELTITLDNNTTARYIRFRGVNRANGYGYALREFRVLLAGVPVLSSVTISSDKEIAKAGEYATLTVEPKDQNNSPIAADLSYSVSPADAGHVTDGKYYPEKYGLATITVTATTSNAEVSNSVQVWGVMSVNLAANKALSTDGSYTSDGGTSHLPGNAVDENYDTWWQGSVNGEGGGASEEARTYEAYFAVDLGNTYNVQLVVINFEGACSEQYNLQFSNNNVDWINGYAYSGNYSGTHVEYISSSDMSNSDAVRYIRFFSTKAKTQYGIKMFEFRVYGTEASTTKTVSATVNPASTGSVTVKAGDPLVEVTEVESGTPVTFTATPAEGYDFVNWTQGGVVIPGAGATYTTTITANTSLVANFEVARTAYCHTPLTDTQGRTLYLSISKTDNENEYKIMLEGSENNKIRGNNVYVGTGLRLRNVNGNTSDAGYHFSNGDGIWTVVERDDNSYGSASVTFTATNFRDISFANKGVDLFRDNSQGGNDLSSFNAFPDAEYIKWDSECSDTEAPEFVKAEAAVLGATSVRLLLQATDNWQINVEYTISRSGADDIVLHGATGEELSQDITGLTAGTEYTFNVTVSDGNMSNSRQIKVTPVGDVTAPTNVTISAQALTDKIVRLTLSADDDYAGDITYNIAYDNAGLVIATAPRGETKTVDIPGLTADTEYHFSVVATDAANNSSDAVNASAVRTYAENLALNKPCTAGHETGIAGEVKEKSNDGDKASRWSSYGSINKGTLDTEDWWAVELDGVYDIRNLRLSWQDARSDNMNVYVSMDGEHWDFVQNFDFMPESSANGETYTNYELTGATGRYVKVLSLHDYFNGQWGISFWELEAYGTLAADVTAPVISSFTADGASTSSVLLKATATDNFNGDLTYTFYCNDVAQGEPIVKASGVEATYTVTGLTMGTDYNFKVNVSDGTNNTMSDVVVGTPINDNQAPENVTVTSEATDYSITLTLSATDNLGGMIYYTVTCGETVKNAEALSGEQVNVLFDGLDYDTPYTFSVVAKDGSNNAADAVAYNETTKPASYPTAYAPAPAFAEASVRPVYSSAYSKDCNFYDWGGSPVEKQTYGAKKLNHSATYFGIADFGTIKVDADDELYLSVWTNENISFKVVPIIRNAENTANLPERGAFTQTLTGGQWNVVSFTMSDFVLNDADAEAGANDNYDRIYQIKIDRAGNQTFWLDNIYFRRKGAIDENANNTEFLTENNNEGQDVTVTRSFAAGNLYTLVLPFDVDAAQTAAKLPGELTKLNNTYVKENGDLRINFVNVAAIEAGVPYLYEPSADVPNPVFAGVTISKDLNPTTPTDNLAAYHGIYAKMDATALKAISNAYVLGSDQYLYDVQDLPAAQEMKALRGYFVLNFPSAAPGAPKRLAKVVFNSEEEQIATGMDELQTEHVQYTKIIENGMLYIVRDGKMYNVQGQLVK